jgi:hypothetical protein
MLRSTGQSGTDVISVARRETSGWWHHCTGAAKPRNIRFAASIKPNRTRTPNQTDVGASPLRYLSRTIPDVSRRATHISSVPDSQVLRNISYELQTINYELQTINY